MEKQKIIINDTITIVLSIVLLLSIIVFVIGLTALVRMISYSDDCRETYGLGYRYDPNFFRTGGYCSYSQEQYEVDVERFGSEIKPRYPLP